MRTGVKGGIQCSSQDLCKSHGEFLGVDYQEHQRQGRPAKIATSNVTSRKPLYAGQHCVLTAKAIVEDHPIVMDPLIHIELVRSGGQLGAERKTMSPERKLDLPQLSDHLIAGEHYSRSHVLREHFVVTDSSHVAEVGLSHVPQEHRMARRASQTSRSRRRSRGSFLRNLSLLYPISLGPLCLSAACPSSSAYLATRECSRLALPQQAQPEPSLFPISCTSIGPSPYMNIVCNRQDRFHCFINACMSFAGTTIDRAIRRSPEASSQFNQRLMRLSSFQLQLASNDRQRNAIKCLMRHSQIPSQKAKPHANNCSLKGCRSPSHWVALWIAYASSIISEVKSGPRTMLQTISCIYGMQTDGVSFEDLCCRRVELERIEGDLISYWKRSIETLKKETSRGSMNKMPVLLT
ncbi:uncharacterized protein MYCFIDRAFT_176841 [Pseudocercospora fijiensis CIRAD86]|uniref:Uncharacterized protein n=1 Tax=Pseudocercospora fijiensis (strain CIRAD86) TaxID=383855 RepID=M3AWP5_PSEFD|nr:uncharacterized protein MYCFIDRAFT_176841 [Pseudocercospora fijiensis CIRAD86]EME81553.1 hypothetical protein MYCFIDRAFT_176841 [Pseudocercospora fijiensis CIRAD86]